MKTGIFYTLIFSAIVLSACTKKELPAKCNMSAEPGICQAAFPKYYYNPNTGHCEQYVWGGCGDFPFDNMEECQSACE